MSCRTRLLDGREEEEKVLPSRFWLCSRAGRCTVSQERKLEQAYRTCERISQTLLISAIQRDELVGLINVLGFFACLRWVKTWRLSTAGGIYDSGGLGNAWWVKIGILGIKRSVISINCSCKRWGKCISVCVCVIRLPFLFVHSYSLALCFQWGILPLSPISLIQLSSLNST